MTSTPLVDVVVVSYNSRVFLRSCVWPLAQSPVARVIVVDNASQDGSLDTLDGLDVVRIPLADNRGFAHGCNVGTTAGSAPYVLLLNPDAAIDEQSLLRLVHHLELEPTAGAVAPKITEPDGTLDHSLRRFPRLTAAYAQALFVHRVLPRAGWSDAVIRDDDVYRSVGDAEWVSGACILLRRAALEEIGGLDEGFFLYSEDVDLCRRLWAAGHQIRYDPDAVCVHSGGGSAPRASLLPVLAESRLRYARKHQSPAGALAMRAAVGLGAATHMVVSKGGGGTRRGHAAALRVALSRGKASGATGSESGATGIGRAVDIARNRN